MIDKLKKNIFYMVRHGESIWNKENKFTGWSNIKLTEKGLNQAYSIGETIKNKNIDTSIIFSSELQRCIETSKIIRNAMNKDVTFKISWRLNEKHYGPCEGIPRSVISNIFGNIYLKKLRSGFNSVPPLIGDCSMDFKEKTPYYNNKQLELGESNKMVLDRVKPYWNYCINDYILQQRNPLIVTHKHSARVILKYLSNMSDDDFFEMDIKNAKLYKITLNDKLKIDDFDKDVVIIN